MQQEKVWGTMLMRGDKFRKVSIVTVSYNAEKTIGRTIRSVLNQSFNDVQYVFVDGGSSDNTVTIIKEYEKMLNVKKISTVVISEPDNGIYDAMNKSLSYCTGEWVQFLNADDYLCDNKVLENIFSKECYSNVSCIYGNTINKCDDKEYIKKAYDISAIYYRVPLIHQAAFVRLSVMKQFRFDLSYEYAADYDLWIRMFLSKEVFLKIDQNIAVFSMEGTSQTNIDKSTKECLALQRKYMLINKKRVKRIISLYLFYYLKKCKAIYAIYMKILSIKKGFNKTNE